MDERERAELERHGFGILVPGESQTHVFFGSRAFAAAMRRQLKVADDAGAEPSEGDEAGEPE